MNFIYNYFARIFPIIVIIALFSCSDEFLEKQPTDSLSNTNAILSAADMEVALNGMYNMFQQSTTYGRDLYQYGSLMGDDAFVSITNSNRFVSINDFSWSTQNGFIRDTWDDLYTMISRANFILEADLGSTPEVQVLKGEAKIARAIGHFELVKHWAQPVNSGIRQELGIPVVRMFDVTAEPSRNTVQEVYDAIEQDLTEAIAEMESSVDKGRLGPNAARLLLSRIYLYQERWDEAAAMAMAVINSGSFSLTSRDDYLQYWSADMAPATVWEIVNTTEDNPGLGSLFYIHDPRGYGQNLASLHFFSTLPDEDIRKQLYIQSSEELGDQPPGYLINKWSLDAMGTSTTNIKVLRYAEAFLNKAEALYHTGDETGALEALNEIASRRYENFTYDSSGDQLLEDILIERRRELAFEGHRLFDLLRYMRDIVKGPNCVNNCTIPFGSDMYVFPIPQPEIDANQNIQQYPGY